MTHLTIVLFHPQSDFRLAAMQLHWRTDHPEI